MNDLMMNITDPLAAELPRLRQNPRLAVIDDNELVYAASVMLAAPKRAGYWNFMLLLMLPSIV